MSTSPPDVTRPVKGGGETKETEISNEAGTMPGPAWLVQAALIARRFYLEGWSKTEIADETGLSRFKVARVLEEARRQGLVQVTVQMPAPIDPDASTHLREQFGLRRAIVVEGPEATVYEDLGRVAADLLTELVTEADVLGLTCSRSVTATTDALTTLASCRVVQLSGTLAGPEHGPGSVESVRRAAAVGGGQAYPIYAPMVLPDAATRAALAGQSGISQTLAQAEQVTVAMVAVGAWSPGFSTVLDTLESAERSQAAGAGVVGEIAARTFDAHGEPVSTPVDARVLSLTLDQLRAIPEVIGLAHGSGRGAAVRAALTGGLLDSLVCDQSLARALLEPADVRE